MSYFRLINAFKLKTLVLNDNELNEIDDSCSLSSLEILNLSKNIIKSIQFLTKCQMNLVELYLSDNNIEDISNIWKHSNLTILSLSNNNVKHLDIPVENTQIQSLTADNNKLEDIDDINFLVKETFSLLFENKQVLHSKFSHRL